MCQLYIGVFTRGREGEGILLGQRTTSFSHVPGDAFQIFCCFAFEALLLFAGVHAVVFPAVAVELLRGAALTTVTAATVIITVSIGVARPRALTGRRVISVTLSLFAGRRRRRGRGLENALWVPTAATALKISRVDPGSARTRPNPTSRRTRASRPFPEHARRLHTC